MADGLDIGMVKLFVLLYVDDIVLFAHSPDELQRLLETLQKYCIRWKLTVDTSKTKIIISKNRWKAATRSEIYLQRRRLSSNFCI